jgi:hypothetical protein
MNELFVVDFLRVEPGGWDAGGKEGFTDVIP